jgi:uncharacterized protein
VTLIKRRGILEKLQQVKEYTSRKLITEVTAHDFSHSLRVMKIANYIGNNTPAAVDLEIINVAGLTHDIIDRKVAPNVGEAIGNLSDELLRIGYTNHQVEHVLDIIQNMSYSSGKIPSTLEGRIVQDADRLEAIGAIAIARTFAYGGKLNRKIYEEGDENSSIAHFYDKLLLLKEGMHTDIGKQIALKRHEFMEAYLVQFHREWDLEDLE